MSEQDTDRKTRLPVEKIHGVDAGFDCRNLIVALTQVLNHLARIGVVFPRNGLFGSQRGFGYARLRRTAGDAAQIELFATRGICRAEERSDIVEAANLIQQYGDGNRCYPLDRASV